MHNQNFVFSRVCGGVGKTCRHIKHIACMGACTLSVAGKGGAATQAKRKRAKRLCRTSAS